MTRAKKKPFSENELTIHALSHEGRGIASLNGKTVFVHGALIGETVRCKTIKHHRRYDEAIVTEIITPAPERVTPPCQHVNICGGCSMQHIDPLYQVQFKEKILLEQLKHFGHVTPEQLLPPLTSELWGYRRKARLGVRYVAKKEKLFVGFREKASNYLTDIQQCAVLHPAVGSRIHELSELVAGLSGYLSIPQIEVAAGDECVALIFRHLLPLSSEDQAKLAEFGKSTGLHIYLQPNPPEPVHCISSENSSPLLSYQLPDYALTFQFHPLDFIQINGDMNRKMVKQAITLLDPKPHEHILDLFCGLGNFTLPIAQYAKQVTGIEGSELMVECARTNAALNHIHQADFYSANLMDANLVKKMLLPEPWIHAYDKILLDPPRTGAQEIIAHFEKFNAKRIVYVSCNPATLARDAKELVHTYHYRLTQAGIMNMFPHTSHIEAIALFEK